MSHPSQVIVTVNIVGVDDQAQIFYSYTDPRTGKVHVNSRRCVIYAVAPFHTLFALDYASTRAGWVVRKVHATHGTPKIPHHISKRRMTLTTKDKGDEIDYRFEIIFYNLYTRKKVPHDPQEGNIAQPR